MYLNVNINDRVNLKVSQVSVNQLLAIQKAISESAQSLDWSVMKSVTVNGNPPADGDNLLPTTGGNVSGDITLGMAAVLEARSNDGTPSTVAWLNDTLLNLGHPNNITVIRGSGIRTTVVPTTESAQGTNGAELTRKDYVDTVAVLIGGITLFNAASMSVPTNWALCDGTKGTPNLPSIDGGSTVYIQRIT